MNPFISILIPTKNRSSLIAHAINSVLTQTFSDFEVLVADNDDDPTATKEVVYSFNDSRISYYRTGSYTMYENWEFIRRKAKGEYITLLEDKQAYYPWALDVINNLVKNTTISVVIWNWDSTNLKAQRKIPELNDFRITSSEYALNQYISGKMPWRLSPRILNSCATRKLIEHISEVMPENKFFIKNSPDLCAAFLQLAFIDKFYFTHMKLGYLHSHLSNASMLRKHKYKMIKYYAGNKKFDLDDSVNLVPIKNPFIIYNNVYNDFLRIRNLIGGKLDKYKMSPKDYAKMCLRDILVTIEIGGEYSVELRDTLEYSKQNLSFMTHFYLLAEFYSKSVYIKIKKLIKICFGLNYE